MLRRLRFVLTLKNESFMLGRSILSSSFHTSQIINRKFNKQQRKTCQRSAMPVAVVSIRTHDISYLINYYYHYYQILVRVQLKIERSNISFSD